MSVEGNGHVQRLTPCEQQIEGVKRRIEVGPIFGEVQVNPIQTIKRNERINDDLSLQWFREKGNA